MAETAATWPSMPAAPSWVRTIAYAAEMASRTVSQSRSTTTARTPAGAAFSTTAPCPIPAWSDRQTSGGWCPPTVTYVRSTRQVVSCVVTMSPPWVRERPRGHARTRIQNWHPELASRTGVRNRARPRGPRVRCGVSGSRRRVPPVRERVPDANRFVARTPPCGCTAIGPPPPGSGPPPIPDLSGLRGLTRQAGGGYPAWPRSVTARPGAIRPDERDPSGRRDLVGPGSM